jgi:hypothetical protein
VHSAQAKAELAAILQQIEASQQQHRL